MATTAMPDRLSPLDRAVWRAQQERAPEGHEVVGPALAPPYWRCKTCRALWSNGVHPPATHALPLPSPDDVREGRRRYAGHFWEQ